MMYDSTVNKMVNFHPYSSIVTKRFFKHEFSNSEEKNQYSELKKELIEFGLKCGIKCHDDNKVVFEVEIDGQRVFFGFYDWNFSIGFGVRKS